MNRKRDVYNMLGKEIATLVNENKSAGFHNISFDASKLTSVFTFTQSTQMISCNRRRCC